MYILQIPFRKDTYIHPWQKKNIACSFRIIHKHIPVVWSYNNFSWCSLIFALGEKLYEHLCFGDQLIILFHKGFTLTSHSSLHLQLTTWWLHLVMQNITFDTCSTEVKSNKRPKNYSCFQSSLLKPIIFCRFESQKFITRSMSHVRDPGEVKLAWQVAIV
jgi:hypothetical protein